MHLPESAREWFAQLAERLRQQDHKPRIVFPEGDDPRVQQAAHKLSQDGLVEPVLLSSHAGGAPPEYARYLYARRKNKGLTERQAEELAGTNLYTAAIMVATGEAAGMVGGAAHTTADTVRAAFHCIGPAPGVETVSSYFVVAGQDRSFGHGGMLIFADCSVVVNPTAAELTDIAIASAGTTRRLLSTEPLVALLSFSTRGSAKHACIDRVAEALKMIHAREPGLLVDGELQADAALVPSVGVFKAPGSVVAGYANTLIFPDVGAGNIAVKLVERLGHALTLGPFLQGLAKPANDLSRGCSSDDIYASAVITALQSVDAAV
ncbi:MAG: phosphate acyltransferase [Acidobacteriota bacterium]|nr:phosphate acyltransferase [Acidobacteriota bacterium]